VAGWIGAAASGGEAGGELVDGLRPAVAEEQQDAPGRRSQRGGRVGQLGQGVVVGPAEVVA
jgi:hypothetical protein